MIRPPHPFCDLWRYVPKGAQSRGIERAIRFIGTAFVHYGWQACFIFRVSQWLHWLRLWPLSFMCHRFLVVAFALDMPPTVQVGTGLWLPHALSIVVHRSVIIGKNATIFHNVTLGGRGYDGCPVIGDDVCIFVSSSVLGAVRIGDRVTVGAHTLVLNDVLAGSIVVGAPARVRKKGINARVPVS